MSLYCRYYNTAKCDYNEDKNVSNKYLPTILFTVDYSKVKDNYEQEIYTALCQKSAPFENNICIQYQHIIGILMYNKEFNTDILDNILIIHNNYAICLKNTNENNKCKGTSLHVDINRIITESDKFKSKQHNLNAVGIAVGVSLAAYIIGTVYSSYFGIKQPISALSKELIDISRGKH